MVTGTHTLSTSGNKAGLDSAAAQQGLRNQRESNEYEDVPIPSTYAAVLLWLLTYPRPLQVQKHHQTIEAFHHRTQQKHHGGA